MADAYRTPSFAVIVRRLFPRDCRRAEDRSRAPVSARIERDAVAEVATLQGLALSLPMMHQSVAHAAVGRVRLMRWPDHPPRCRYGDPITYLKGHTATRSVEQVKTLRRTRQSFRKGSSRVALLPACVTSADLRFADTASGASCVTREPTRATVMLYGRLNRRRGGDE